MPMHDWTKVKSGIYHNFHYRWVAAIMDRLNAGLLPSGYFAMAEQIIGRPETDVVTLQTSSRLKRPTDVRSGTMVAAPPPQTRFVLSISPEQERYARKANQVVIRHELGDVVAVIEIVSPGNKDRAHSLHSFVDKAIDILQQQVNLLVIDPFPPGSHDPQGIHGAIWEQLSDLPALGGNVSSDMGRTAWRNSSVTRAARVTEIAILLLGRYGKSCDSRPLAAIMGRCGLRKTKRKNS